MKSKNYQDSGNEFRCKYTERVMNTGWAWLKEETLYTLSQMPCWKKNLLNTSFPVFQITLYLLWCKFVQLTFRHEPLGNNTLILAWFPSHVRQNEIFIYYFTCSWFWFTACVIAEIQQDQEAAEEYYNRSMGPTRSCTYVPTVQTLPPLLMLPLIPSSTSTVMLPDRIMKQKMAE